MNREEKIEKIKTYLFAITDLKRMSEEETFDQELRDSFLPIIEKFMSKINEISK